MSANNPLNWNEELTACMLLKEGKASPEQQMRAYKYYNSRMEEAWETRPKKKMFGKETVRNVLIELRIRKAKADGKKLTQRDVCKGVAIEMHRSVDTIEREFRRWKEQSAEHRRQDEQAVLGNIQKMLDMVTSTNFESTKSGEN